jgi:two-component system, sensor histidine kinase PdtaS
MITFRRAVIGSVVILLAYLGLAAVARTFSLSTEPLTLIVHSGVGVLATLSLILAARFSPLPSQFVRFAFIALALAMFFNTFGELVNLGLVLQAHVQAFPSLADGFYLLFYPFFATGILFLTAASLVPTERFKMTLDTSMVLIAAILVCWAWVIAPIIAPMLNAKAMVDNGPALYYSIINAVMDGVLLFAVIQCLLAWRASVEPRLVWLLALGAIGKIGTDAADATLISHDLRVIELLPGVLWTTSYLLIGLAGVLQVSSRHAAALWMPPRSEKGGFSRNSYFGNVRLG